MLPPYRWRALRRQLRGRTPDASTTDASTADASAAHASFSNSCTTHTGATNASSSDPGAADTGPPDTVASVASVSAPPHAIIPCPAYYRATDTRTANNQSFAITTNLCADPCAL